MCDTSGVPEAVGKMIEKLRSVMSSKTPPIALAKAYRALAVKCHPDKGGSPKDFQNLSRAYKHLSNPSSNYYSDTDDSDSDHNKADSSHGETAQQ